MILNSAFNPLVSIIIPVYNGSNYMKEAIDSALAQTYRSIEIIVVNDGSNDEGRTEEIALSYGKRIKYFSKINEGVSTALNLGIEKMNGEYFSWLSHDDVYFPNKIEAQINHLLSLKDNSTVIYSDFNYIDEKSNLIEEYFVKDVPPELFRPAFIFGGIISGCTLLVSKKCFIDCGLFNEKLRTTQDYDLWFRISEKYPFAHLPQILVSSRVHANQVGNKLFTMMKAEENKLYTHFILKIRNNEINLFNEKPIPFYYLDYSEVMLNRNIKRAAYFSLLLGIVNFWRLNKKHFSQYLFKVGALIKRIFNR